MVGNWTGVLSWLLTLTTITKQEKKAFSLVWSSLENSLKKKCDQDPPLAAGKKNSLKLWLMDEAHLSLDGSFQSLPLGLLWHLLSHLELPDLIRFSTTSKKALEITRSRDFWIFLYYHHLIPSPIYYDIGHAALIDPPTVSWLYLYLEQLWAQCTLFPLFILFLSLPY